MLLACIKRLLVILALLNMTFPVFAEDAPVYDVDNFPPQFDGGPVASIPPPAVKPQESYGPTQTLTQEQRLMRLEQQIKNLNPADSTAKAETIQAEIQSLRGQVEELSHQLQQTQNQQRAIYTDLDKRLGQSVIEKKPPQALADNEVDVKKSSTAVASTAKEAHLAHVASTKKSSSLLVTPVKATGSTDQPNVAEEQQIYQTAYDLIKEKKIQ